MSLKTKEQILSEKIHDFDSLVSIMSHLRGDNGCPWDKEQDHLSIRKCLIEEAYEVVESIDTDDKKLMCEELGDLIFQAIFHARIEEEQGTFDISDVINGVCNKMIRRHPHVYSDLDVRSSADVSLNWDDIKKEEKAEQNKSEAFMSAPAYLPALIKAQKFHGKASKKSLGFSSREDALEFAKRNIDNIPLAVFALSAVSEFDGIDLEKHLNDVVKMYIQKYTN